MLPRADAPGTRPVAYVEASAPVRGSTDTRQEVFSRLNQIALGQQLPAKVIERLNDGTFLVRLANTSARMSLPVGTKVGDQLSMTLLERQPRPTFLLGAAGDAQSGDAPATLSSAARLIDRLLQSSQQNGGSTALIGRVPILPSPAAGAPMMAAALQDAVDVSGLFYESHLAQWVQGSRSLAALLREPQARQANTLHQGDTATTESALLRHLAEQWVGSGRALTDLAAELQARTGNFLMPGADAATQQQAAAAYLNKLLQEAAQNAAAQTSPETVSTQAAQMINAQLHALENQRFVWQGELWPGQTMEWEVSRDAPDGGDQGSQDTGQESWQSAMKFELPTLGTVSATLHLVGNRVSVFVRTESEHSAVLLRAHGGELADALDAAGSKLDALMVNDHGQT